jgi:hypothetical protein
MIEPVRRVVVRPDHEAKTAVVVDGPSTGADST